MKIDLSVLVSPINKTKLHLNQDTNLEDEEGNIFQIKDGIPRFVSSENYSSNFGKQWNYFKKTQIDKYNGTKISENRLFNDTKWSKESLKGQKILEVGSGAGRFTDVLLRYGAEVYSVDYSNAVDANMDNNSPSANLHLFQADIYHLPFQNKTFDKVFCFGVLQHTPNVYLSFQCLLEKLKDGGQIAIDTYPLTWKTIFMQKYYYRLITKRLNHDTLLKIINFYVPKWFKISSFMLRYPILRYFSQTLPIANYTGCYDLSEEELLEWAIMDTFDMLAPAYDNPQTKRKLKKWFLSNNILIEYIGNGVNGFCASGTKSKEEISI